MHRRQYLPGSDRKVSRARLAVQNKQLIDLHNRTVAQRNAEEEARKRAEEQKQNSGIRGFINRAKRALTKPLTLGRRRA